MDVFTKPANPDTDVVKNLGPLAALAGTWEGDQGVDVSPGKNGSVETKYREKCTFEPLGPVVNGPQVLYALRYHMTAWPLGQESPFHEELGYWQWDPENKRVVRAFMIPRATLVSAVGSTDAKATSFNMSAKLGNEGNGIISTPGLSDMFKTTGYELKVKLSADTFAYEEDTILQIQGMSEAFHHTDKNTLKKIS